MSDRDAYAEAHTTPVSPELSRLAAETFATQECPEMLVGPVAGRFLEMLVWAANAKRVLEIGTYTGYSAQAMASVLGEGGSIVTCELDPERAAFAQDRLGDAPVEIRVGPALETIATLDGPFDLVFIDADKDGYPAYFEAVLPKLAPRGLIVLDNMFRGGRVLEAGGDEVTEVVRELNRSLPVDDRVVAVLLPIRDGMTVVRRAYSRSGRGA